MGTGNESGRRRTVRRVVAAVAIAGAAGLTLTMAVAAWADGTDPPAPRGAADRLSTPERRDERAGVIDHGLDAIRTRYLEVLRDQAVDAEAAPRRIAELQQEAFRHHSLRGLDKLHRYQVTMATTLAARDRACFRPIAWVHYRAARHHRAPGDLALRGPAIEVAADIAAAMTRSARSEDERRFAVDVLLCSAHTLLGDGARGHAQRMFERAIRFAPDSAPALVGAAAIDERYGRFEEVVARLEPAVAEGAGDDEARLRLAVNLARTGRDEAALEILEGLVTGPSAGWVRVVASQELVRALIGRGRLEQAESVLRDSIAALPEAGGLRVQLAFVLDRAGRPSAAAREIEVLGAVGGDAGEAAAARWRYAEWPAFDRGGVEARLAREAEVAAPALRAVLASVGSGSAS